MINKEDSQIITFKLGDMIFEYDEWKNEYNIEHHGLSFKYAARVFFDYYKIELYDEENSRFGERYNTIENLSVIDADISAVQDTVIGNINPFGDGINDIIFVVYTERVHINIAGEEKEITRLISARFATNFEKRLYYGKYQ